MDIKGLLPPGYSWREAWDFTDVSGVIVPSHVRGGHPLTLANGAAKRTTCDGVHFTGAATSYINCGAIHNAATKLWVSFRFKLDSSFTAGSANQFLFGKFIDDNSKLQLWFYGAEGPLYFQMYSGGVLKFSVFSSSASWVANTWYHVLFSISSVAGVRFRINAGAAVTHADTTAVPNGGDFVMGNLFAGYGSGFKGIITDFFCGTDDLTLTEEADLYKGIPPADAVHIYTMDEGRGATVYDRGSAPANGTLGSACKWVFGKTDLACLSPDGIDASADSAAAVVNMAAPFSVVWAGKIKSTYAVASLHSQLQFWIGASDWIDLVWSNSILTWSVRVAGVATAINWSHVGVIDNYEIIIASLDAAGITKLFSNGALGGSNTGGVSPVGLATALICRNSVAQYDVSKPSLVGLINGALTDADVMMLSRRIDKRFKLGLGI
jgi:hypothetical protein